MRFYIQGAFVLQFLGFSVFENFQAQTWVEHAIFALREPRLTTWPLRLVIQMKSIDPIMPIINAHVRVFVMTENSENYCQ